MLNWFSILHNIDNYVISCKIILKLFVEFNLKLSIYIYFCLLINETSAQKKTFFIIIKVSQNQIISNHIKSPKSNQTKSQNPINYFIIINMCNVQECYQKLLVLMKLISPNFSRKANMSTKNLNIKEMKYFWQKFLICFLYTWNLIKNVLPWRNSCQITKWKYFDKHSW